MAVHGETNNTGPGESQQAGCVVLSNLVRKSSLRRFEQRAPGSEGVGRADILRKAS